MANLSEARTGVPGVIWISTQVARPGPQVKYYEKPGRAQPSFSVSIEEAPKVVAGDLPERVIKRMSPQGGGVGAAQQGRVARFLERGRYLDERRG